jgi:oxygen-independent coproporphyrinogen-3 oxidase
MSGVYISWPFCAQKCTYCNFASGVFPRELERQYADALEQEIRTHRWDWTPETLYIGGGTPSGLDPELLARVLAAVPGAPWPEATIEAAPGTLDAARVTAWRAAGINRVSLGVQSFVKAELARTGRKHDAETVAHDVGLLREAGITNINIDLIAGLPGQTDESWQTSLNEALRLDVPHVSVYMLEVDDDSRLGFEILSGGKRYGADAVPDEDRIAAFYEGAVDDLARHGIVRYEISNFARPGAQSLHNLKYWRREPYIGFGADAHSFDGEWRRQNTERAQDYVASFRAGAPFCTERTRSDAAEEKFFVGLRLSAGVETDAGDWQRFGASFERFLSLGVMEKSGERLRLTPRGVMISNEIFQEFLAS